MSRYMCGKCKFSFKRAGEVEACPKCGSYSVRYAADDSAERQERPCVTRFRPETLVVVARE